MIRCFSSERPSLTLSEGAERTGLTRAAARRFLLTLQELGYVGSSGRQFSLRPRVLALGYAYTKWKTTGNLRAHAGRRGTVAAADCPGRTRF